jgi:orotate phosphoribosyltransferase
VSHLRQQFIEFSVNAGVLRFGEFVTKAGRLSPYFFNAGLFNDGARLGQLANFYAQTLLDAGVGFDMLFGPAYKGITLASATSVALAAKGRNVPFAYNRKEAKVHGEGGTIVGAKLEGRVVIIDDVISAGTSVRESVQMIRAHGATPCAVLIALDQMSVGGNIVRQSFLILLAGAVFALSLAFGLGGRRWAARMLDRWWPADRDDDQRR